MKCSTIAMTITLHLYYSPLYLIVMNITPHRGLFCQKYKKNFCHHKNLQIFKLSHPIVMGGRAETMHNQITFVFSKEQHEKILSMHLTKLRKSEKLKNKKLKFVKESYLLLLSYNFTKHLICIRYSYSLNMQTTKTSSTQDKK